MGQLYGKLGNDSFPHTTLQTVFQLAWDFKVGRGDSAQVLEAQFNSL